MFQVRCAASDSSTTEHAQDSLRVVAEAWSVTARGEERERRGGEEERGEERRRVARRGRGEERRGEGEERGGRECGALVLPKKRVLSMVPRPGVSVVSG